MLDKTALNIILLQNKSDNIILTDNTYKETLNKLISNNEESTYLDDLDDENDLTKIDNSLLKIFKGNTQK
jgi:hypothetical protein